MGWDAELPGEPIVKIPGLPWDRFGVPFSDPRLLRNRLSSLTSSSINSLFALASKTLARASRNSPSDERCDSE